MPGGCQQRLYVDAHNIPFKTSQINGAFLLCTLDLGLLLLVLLIDFDRQRTIGDGKGSPRLYSPCATTCTVNRETADTAMTRETAMSLERAFMRSMTCFLIYGIEANPLDWLVFSVHDLQEKGVGVALGSWL